MDNRKKILAVDDEPRNLKILQISLGNEWEIKTASTGEEALEILKDYNPDLILLDIMMPGIDGYEVCRQVRTDPELALTKVILISGKAMIEERLKGYECGADDYITKPFIPEELLAKVRVFIKLVNIERQLFALNQSLEEQVKTRTQQLIEAEAKMIYSEKMSALGEMAGGIAHEINTPLATIYLNSEMLVDSANDGDLNKEDILKYVSNVNRTAERIAKIIRGLKTFSRDGNNDPFEETSIKDLVDDTLQFCNSKLANQGIILSRPEISQDLKLNCRATQVSQVLVNLLNNAYDAVENATEKNIEITCVDLGDYLQISLIDSGPGVPDGLEHKIMQPFFTTKDIGKGTGLGLSVSKGIMDSHGGSLCYERANGKTCFSLRFPKVQPAKLAS